MTSKLTILSIETETAAADVRRLQRALFLLEKLRQRLEQSPDREPAEVAAQAAHRLREAIREIREAARKYENAELAPEEPQGTGCPEADSCSLADAAAEQLAEVLSHEAWACGERDAIDGHISQGKQLVHRLQERLTAG